MRQIFVSPGSYQNGRFVLAGHEAHHVKNVLRIRAGDIVSLFDGMGGKYRARVEEIGKNAVILHVMEKQEQEEKGVRLHLAQAILKGKKMDLVIQKAVELGIHGITPFTSRYCDILHPAEGKEERWQRIIVEACKQCGRTTAPQLTDPLNFNQLVVDKSNENKCKIILDENEELQGIDGIFSPSSIPRAVTMVIGPEGGFHPDEISLARDCGFQPVSLGALTLRAETAAIVAVGIVQFLLGNLGKTT